MWWKKDFICSMSPYLRENHGISKLYLLVVVLLAQSMMKAIDDPFCQPHFFGPSDHIVVISITTKSGDFRETPQRAMRTGIWIPAFAKPTFHDSTLLADPSASSDILLDHLHAIGIWCRCWRVKVNGAKSLHVTFKLRHQPCPLLTINTAPILSLDNPHPISTILVYT